MSAPETQAGAVKLVERLREPVSWRGEYGGPMPEIAKDSAPFEAADLITTLQAQLDEAREALRLYHGAACPVAAEINPRGYNWCEAYLDEARANAANITSQQETGNG